METTKSINNYKRAQLRNRKRIVISAVILLMIAVTVLFLGVQKISLSQILISFTGDTSPGIDSLNSTVLFSIRFPRIIAAVVVGAALSLSGCIMQSITQNDMATPFTTGVSSAAGFGAALSIVLPNMWFTKTPVLLAFVSAMIATGIVYGLSLKLKASVQTMVLFGIAFNYLFSALNSLLQYFANEQQLASIVYWTFGSLTNVSWYQIVWIATILLVASLISLWNSNHYDIMAANNDIVAYSMGVDAFKLRIISGVVVTLLSAVVVSYTGVIGFVGMVGPHLAQRIVGLQHRYLLPMSMILGSVLVLIADTFGRTLISPVSIPVGVCVSLIGVPLFIVQIMKHSKGGSHGS